MIDLIIRIKPTGDGRATVEGVSYGPVRRLQPSDREILALAQRLGEHLVSRVPLDPSDDALMEVMRVGGAVIPVVPWESA